MTYEKNQKVSHPPAWRYDRRRTSAGSFLLPQGGKSRRIATIKGFELEVKHVDGLGRMLLHKNNPTGYTESVVLRFRYIHELFNFLEIYTPSIKLEWKGVQK